MIRSGILFSCNCADYLIVEAKKASSKDKKKIVKHRSILLLLKVTYLVFDSLKITLICLYQSKQQELLSNCCKYCANGGTKPQMNSFSC